MDVKSRRLDPWWQNKLDKVMAENFPDVIDDSVLVESFKRDGWNDGTSTLFGVYQRGDNYILCTFADYEEPKIEGVRPIFEHVGWEGFEKAKVKQ